MKFKKAGADQHGPIVNAITDNGFCIGQVMKWHGLFIAKDWRGETVSPWPVDTRKEAGELLLEHFEFERGAA